MNARILLVEDDPSLGFVMKDGLSQKGHDVTLCIDGEAGLDAFNRNPFDICIFDIMMPRKDGFSLAQEIRRENSRVPILFVTAKSMVEDRILGFQAGGDDYIVKPFSMEELCLRVDVFLRRTQDAPQNVYSLGQFTFNYEKLSLHHPQGQKSLTQKEAEVLKLLCVHKDRILKREEILKSAWGDDDYFLGRSLDVFISRLRKYMRPDPSVEIVNYHGVGFRLELRN